ncbi:uncharacterized protein LOC108629643 isoform X1 [Ceratina calcarata]|uniref:Uncharacterized protein LOC108629643 isoform X1 n=1 Tax=Ceratina calcarata TaxID=156304 RepID=A0AAJ7WFA4_9HYME|nr:uncharacterized protein LOC108629643 isoform X1 [Ceratina calcarata]
MVKLRAFGVLISFGILSGNMVEPLMQEGLSKFFGTITGIRQLRIPELLNQLCNESQGSNMVRRDACYGCFYRVSRQPIGYSLLVSMSSCADMYLNGTDYGHCQRYLSNATNALNSRINPTTIYCTFLDCVRQQNRDNLLTECVGEAVRIFPNFTVTDVKLAQLYVNTTACVLARSRCSQTNPITGEFQEDVLANKLHIPTINAVLVNTDYDINIIQLPFYYGSINICSKQRNYEQASWPGVTC